MAWKILSQKRYERRPKRRPFTGMLGADVLRFDRSLDHSRTDLGRAGDLNFLRTP